MKISQFLSIISLISVLLTACEPQAGATEAPNGGEQTQAPESESNCPEPSTEFNDAKTVSFVLPSLALPDSGASGVVFRIVPPANPPTEDPSLLGQCDVIIGKLIAERDLPLSDPDVRVLPPETYRVLVSQGVMVFIDSSENEYRTSLEPEIRTVESRDILPPENFITVKDICYSWHHVQVCTEPVPNNAITETERRTMTDRMTLAVQELVTAGLIQQDDINVEGTIPDMVGNTAVELQQASLIAAPTVNFPSQNGQELPDDGALLGVVVSVLPVDKPGYPDLPEGVYAVFAMSQGQNEWQGRFVTPDQTETLVPARFVEVRGQIEEPLAIVIDLRICLCFFQC